MIELCNEHIVCKTWYRVPCSKLFLLWKQYLERLWSIHGKIIVQCASYDHCNTFVGAEECTAEDMVTRSKYAQISTFKCGLWADRLLWSSNITPQLRLFQLCLNMVEEKKTIVTMRTTLYVFFANNGCSCFILNVCCMIVILDGDFSPRVNTWILHHFTRFNLDWL